MNNANTSKPPDENPRSSSHSSDSTQVKSKGVLGAHLIIVVTIFITCGLFVTYTLSLTSGHVEDRLCYISYTGDFPIESCIFSTVFSLSSLLYCIIIYFRFIQISEMLNAQNLPEKAAKKIRICNIVSMVFGEFGAFGLNITGCFQRRLFQALHMLGVIFCTYFCYIYFVFQIYFSFRLAFLATSTFIKVLRLLMIILSGGILFVAPMFPLYLLVASASDARYEKQTARSEQDLYWVGAILEWILFYSYQALLFSFYPDMKKIVIKTDQIIVIMR